jgi:hypothetical protein
MNLKIFPLLGIISQNYIPKMQTEEERLIGDFFMLDLVLLLVSRSFLPDYSFTNLPQENSRRT